MVIRNVLKCAVVLAACLVLPAAGQTLVVLPGAAATSSTASAFAPDPFAAAGTLNAAPGAFQVYSSLDGSRFFIITTTGVVVVDSSGAQVQSPLPISQTVNGAALSPDGKHLVVVAGDSASGSAHIFDVSGATAGEVTAVSVDANPLDVAIEPDSTTAFVLSTGALTPIDLSSNTAGSAASLAVAVSGNAKPGVAVGPNGLVYVNAQSIIYELDPTTLAQLNNIPVTGFPGKLSFYSDGKTAAVANQLISSPAATMLDMVGHVVTNTLTFQFAFDRLFYVSPTVIYAYSSASGFLYSFSPSSPSPTFKVAAISSSGNIKSVAASSDAGTPHWLYLVRASGVTAVDLTATPPTSATAALATPAGPAFYLGVAQGNVPWSVAQFNAAQTIAPAGTSLPLAVRLLDQSGIPVANQPVRWTKPSGVTLLNAMVFTNAQGYATAYAQMPTQVGSYTVSVQFPNSHVINQSFVLNVGSVVNPGGGGGTATPGISILSGNGQVVRSSALIAEPMVVFVTDNNGKPASGVPVVFSSPTVGVILQIYSVDPSQTNCVYVATGLSCRTDSRGLASVNFQGYPVNDTQFSYINSTVTAAVAASSTVPAGSVVFSVTSVPATVTTSPGSTGPLPAVLTIAPVSSQTTFTGQAGQTLKGALQVKVSALLSGLPIPNVGLSVRPTINAVFGQSTPAQCSAAGHAALSNAQGIATCDLVLGSTPGTYSLYRVVGGYDTTAIYTLKITAPASVATTISVVNGNNQTGIVGQVLPLALTAAVKDQFGAVMANAPVTWTVLQGSVTLTNKPTVTNAQGVASTNVTPNAAGAIQVKVASGNVSAIFQLTGTVTVTSLTKVNNGGDGQSATEGAAFTNPLVVQVNTAQGPLANYTVSFAITGNSTLSAATVNTNAQGQASVTVTAGSTPGAVQVTASVGGSIASVVFNLLVKAPGPQLTANSFLNGASFQQNFLSFGSIATIMATGLTTNLNLSPGTCLTPPDGIDGLPSNDTLPTRLAGVEILFSGNLAPIFAICKNADGSEQANVQVPFELAPATITVTVRYNAGTSNKLEFTTDGVQIQNAAPGIFEYMADSSTKLAVAVKDDGSLIGPSNPAHPGDTVHVYTTGLGPVLPHVGTNQLGVAGEAPYFTPTATLGGTQMGGVTAAYSEGMIGIFVVSFQIPSDQVVGTVPLAIGVVKKPDNTPAASQTSQLTIAAK